MASITLPYVSPSGTRSFRLNESFAVCSKVAPKCEFSFQKGPKTMMAAKHLKSVPPAIELKLTTATVLGQRIIELASKAIALHFLICGTLLGQSPTPSPTLPVPSSDPNVTQINHTVDAQRFDLLARQAAQRINPRATLYRPTLSIAPNPTPAIKSSTPVASQEEADQTMQKSLADFDNLAQKNPDQLRQQLASAMYLARDLQLRRAGQPSVAQHSFQRSFGSIKLPESGSIKDLADIWQLNKQSQFGAPATTYLPGAVESIPVDLALEVAPLLSITAPWAIGDPGWYSANYQSHPVVGLGASTWSQKIEQFMVTHGLNFQPVSWPAIVPSTAVIFHVSCQFKDRSDTIEVGNVIWGNHGHYEMKVQVLQANSDGTVAIDPNTKQPVWKDASPIARLDLFGPGATNLTLPTNSSQPASSGGTAQGDLAAPATFTQVANIVRIGFRFFLGDTRDSGLLPEQTIAVLNTSGQNRGGTPGQYISVPVNYPVISDENKAWAFTRPLEIDIPPSELIQFAYAPIAILYAPPGDSSTASYQIHNSYAAKIAFGKNWSNEYKTSNTSTFALQQQFGIDLNGILRTNAGLSASTKPTQEWDSSQWNSGCTTLGNQEVILLGSTEQITRTLSWGKPQPPSASKPTASTPSGSFSTPPGSTPPGSTPNTAMVPFWCDVIILVAHPQFAIWDYEAAVMGDGPGLNALQMIGQLPGYSAVSIAQLSEIISNWATGTTQYETGWNKAPYFPVPLTPYECTSLLSLDPFWVAQWQGWPGTQAVSTRGSNPVTDSGGRAAFIWGGRCGLNAGQATVQVILSQEGDNTSTMQVDYASRVDSAFKSTVSADGTITVTPINFGVTATAGQTSENSAELDLSFRSSNEGDLKNQVQIHGSLNNSESEIYVTTYRDLLYGGMMFQDVGEPGPLKQTYLPCIWYGKTTPLTIKEK
jgi:hypothetical protein